MTNVRTSLDRTPSSYTPEQIQARAIVAQAEAAAMGVLLVRVNDPRLNDWERQFARNLIAKLTNSAKGRKAR